MNAQIKNALGVVLLIALLGLLYVSYTFVQSYDKSIEPSSFRSFTVSGDGEVIGVPDTGQFSFRVITEGGTDVAALQEENTEKINTMIEYLKDQGIEEEDIQTQSYQVDPRYEYYRCDEETGECPPPEIVGYTIRQGVQVRTKDFDLVGTLLQGVVDRGANNVSNLSFTIDDRTELENQAREKAIEKAAEKAQGIADAGGFDVGRILSIREEFAVPEPPQPFLDGRGGGATISEERAAPAPTVEPGSQKVRVTIFVDYEIE